MDNFLRVGPPLASLAVFVVPFTTVSNISKNQTTGDLPPLTFVSMAVMCAIWGTYGGLKGDMTVLVPNVFGSLVSLYYLYVFESHVPKGAKANELSRWYQVGIALLAVILLLVTFEEVSTAAGYIGTCGAALSVVFSASPLLALPAVMKSRSPDSIPLPTAVILFINSILWCAYGLSVADDRTIWIPNLVGAFVTAAQLLVHAVFQLGLIQKVSDGSGVKVASL